MTRVPLAWCNLSSDRGKFLLSALAIGFAVMLLFVQLWLSGADRLLHYLVAPGRMTLTLYIGQSLVFVPVYYGFGLHLWDRITQPEALK